MVLFNREQGLEAIGCGFSPRVLSVVCSPTLSSAEDRRGWHIQSLLLSFMPSLATQCSSLNPVTPFISLFLELAWILISRCWVFSRHVSISDTGFSWRASLGSSQHSWMWGRGSAQGGSLRQWFLLTAGLWRTLARLHSDGKITSTYPIFQK